MEAGGGRTGQQPANLSGWTGWKVPTCRNGVDSDAVFATRLECQSARVCGGIRVIRVRVSVCEGLVRVIRVSECTQRASEKEEGLV